MKKTLSLRPVGERADAPKIQKKGRGWAISGSRLDAIHDRARQLRREPDEAHLALAEELAKEDLGKYKDRKSTRLNSSHIQKSRMPSSA